MEWTVAVHLRVFDVDAFADGLPPRLESHLRSIDVLDADHVRVMVTIELKEDRSAAGVAEVAETIVVGAARRAGLPVDRAIFVEAVSRDEHVRRLLARSGRDARAPVPVHADAQAPGADSAPASGQTIDLRST